MLIVDTGVLLAAADNADPDHHQCAELLADESGTLVTTALVVAETGYLVDRQLGATAEATFYRSIADGDIRVERLAAADWKRIAELIDQYSDLPLGGTDASLVVLAERLGEQRIATLDQRHFTVVRPRRIGQLQILPSSSAEAARL